MRQGCHILYNYCKLIALALLFLIAQPGYSGILEVGMDHGIKSISEALLMANPGDTIMVHGGRYREGNIDIHTPVVLLGIKDPVLDGENQYEIMRIHVDSVTVKGFVFRDVGISYVEDRSALRLINNSHCIIDSNTLINAFFGIYLEHCSDIIIRNNRITGEARQESNSGNAIHLWYCKNIIIEDNYAEGHRDGIYLEFVDDSRVARNTVFRNLRYGLHFMYSDHDLYLENRFEQNGAGVAVMFSKYIEMVSNEFLNNWGSSSYGLLLKEITDSQILYNRFQQNTTGIYGEGVIRTEIQHNDFVRNGWAMNILGSCSKIEITRNNFLHNSFEVSTNSSRNYNHYDGNYWSDNTNRYDLDNDGISDVPYRPVKLFSYMIGYMQSSTILMRSLLIDLVNYAEKVAPVITPGNLIDNKPMMGRIEHDRDTGLK